MATTPTYPKWIEDKTTEARQEYDDAMEMLVQFEIRMRDLEATDFMIASELIRYAQVLKISGNTPFKKALDGLDLLLYIG